MNIFVEVVGAGSGKPPLALLHGWGLNGAVWNSVREPLADHFTLHIVDLPGHGNSRDVPLTTLDAAADLLADTLPSPTHLLGWSMGGQIALTYARRHPAHVKKLVLVATTPCFVASEEWPHGVKAEVLDDFAQRLTTNYATTIRGFLALQTLQQPSARATIAALQTAMSERGEPSVASLQAGLHILRTSDLRVQLALISLAALIIQGDHDALTPEPAARWLANHLPNANYALIQHAAHAPFLSHRDLFLEQVLNHLLPLPA